MEEMPESTPKRLLEGQKENKVRGGDAWALVIGQTSFTSSARPNQDYELEWDIRKKIYEAFFFFFRFPLIKNQNKLPFLFSLFSLRLLFSCA
jgi:hypothetical protein